MAHFKDRLATPLLRAYVRYAPFLAGKRPLWTQIIGPRFAWHPHDFVAPTVFGGKIAGNTQDIIQQYIYYFGVWEPNLTAWIARSLRPGDTFIDVGANLGYFSLLASKLVGQSGKVVAIEPSLKIFHALDDNLRRNFVRNVRAVNMAAADRQGAIRVFRGPVNNIGLTTTREERGFELECEVEAAPLAAILDSQEQRNARVIKIDVEGAEWSVVAGMRPLLTSGRADLEIMVEVEPAALVRWGKQVEDLLRVFREAGFCVYRLENDYSALSYLPPRPEKRPERLRGLVESKADLIFSRRDAEHL